MLAATCCCHTAQSRSRRHRICGAGNILGIVARAVQNVNLVGAGILAAIHFGVFVALLSLWDLSLVIPLGALDYALVTIAARYLLGETVRPMRWAGVALIVTGVAMTSLT